MHLWVEQRELDDADPVMRGRASAVETDHQVAFTDLTALNDFMIDELIEADLLDAGAQRDVGAG